MFYAKEMELCSYMKLNDKWIVKKPKFGSYCTINCWGTNNDIQHVYTRQLVQELMKWYFKLQLDILVSIH